ncbi:hypothetical protein ACFUJR_25945 [Streptomyces sp. NPDC057271]|uniref:hypothetical protein n=1 Tax=unclassified Streptomyces TaxID=2593676 RepID=UPI003629C48C
MPTPSEHTRLSLEARLGERARTAWPQLEQLHIRHRGAFAYVEAGLADGERVKLMRLRYTGAVGRWGFALYPGFDIIRRPREPKVGSDLRGHGCGRLEGVSLGGGVLAGQRGAG